MELAKPFADYNKHLQNDYGRRLRAIEEAADRAEKPSLGKAIKGLFSSKYDKDGMLILKEEHFI